MARMKGKDIKNLDFDSDKNMCFLTKLENDLQLIFNGLYTKFPSKNKCFHVKNVLKKGSLFHKGDFFLSLRSDHIYFSEDVKKELLDEINGIPYVCETEIDEPGNLILCLNRPVIFRSILNNVLKYGNSYGMKTTDKSFLVLIHNEVFKNFDALRIAIVANHLISFLTATGAKVYVNEYRKDAELAFKEVQTYTCSDICLQKMKELCEIIENLAESSEWSTADDGSGNTIINLKKFVTVQSLCYGKDANTITVCKKIPHAVINQTAYVAHFQQSHDINPNHVIQICSVSQQRKIIDSGLLIEMLDLLPASQIFITCQTTVFTDDELELTVDAFMDYIEKAMTHRYDSSTLIKEIWSNYMKTLVDTSVKFYFLKTGTNVPLKIDSLIGENTARNNKGGIFIQYNFARLSGILETFDQKVKEGYYESLPPIDDVDFSLLKFEEEWNLLNFVLAFPRLIEEIFCSVVSRHSFPASRICIMLTKLSSCFSVYYSRIHILGGPQPQLQKVMFARLWLLKGIQQIISNSFTLLNVKGLNKM